MKEGPDIASVAQLIGDPARANMLSALMSGKALTASELAAEAGVTAQTASSHLAKLQTGGLLAVMRQGRYRYFALSGSDVAEALEALMGLAAAQGRLRTRTGPNDPALRHARSCYRHLAGEQGVALYEALLARKALVLDGEGIGVTESGAAFLREFGVEIEDLCTRGPVGRACLDWSMRRSHLGGALGRAVLARIIQLGWARQAADSRAILFTATGANTFRETFLVK